MRLLRSSETNKILISFPQISKSSACVGCCRFRLPLTRVAAGFKVQVLSLVSHRHSRRINVALPFNDSSSSLSSSPLHLHRLNPRGHCDSMGQPKYLYRSPLRERNCRALPFPTLRPGLPLPLDIVTMVPTVLVIFDLILFQAYIFKFGLHIVRHVRVYAPLPPQDIEEIAQNVLRL